MARCWIKVLDVGLTFWVLRGPVVAVAVGAAILLLVPQAQDLLVEPVTDGIVSPLLLGLGVLFAWAIPTHYAARLLVTTDARYGRRMGAGQCRLGKCKFRALYMRKYLYSPCCFRSWLVTWSPRLLGVLIFAVLIGAALKARFNIPDLKDERISERVRGGLILLATAFAVLMAVFLTYAVERQKLATWSGIAAAERFARAVWNKVPAWLRTPFSLNPAKAEAASALGPLLLLVLFAVLAVWPIIQPYRFAKLFARAAAVPFVLGGWVPVVALLSGLGRRYRAPFITFALLLILLLPTVFHSSYRVRLVNANDQASTVMRVNTAVDTSGLTLNDAVRFWKANNPCDQQGCPRPIIVAASGGASRAGFFTASVIGQMLDGGLANHRPGTADLSGEALRNRLFAFSTVSGSSVGAVMAAAAMTASPDGKQPCTGKSPLWYGAGAPIDSWRDCLEALMAGDFLTPIFTGLVFHDVLRFIGWKDRGALLERSFEDQFKELVERGPSSTPAAPCTGDLGCPFMALRPTQTHWWPILILNSTSVETGQRIITTTLERHFQSAVAPCPLEPRLDKDPGCPLFESSRTFHELLGSSENAHAPNDVKLSTAAHNSARFPLLSPPGEIRNEKEELVDRIVDGGYFENLGVQTATELAEAIAAVDSDLKPFLLVITNDPTLSYERKEQARLAAEATRIQAEMRKLPQRSQSDVTQARGSATSSIMNLLTDVAAPLSAVFNTRDARGILALEDVPATLYSHNAGCNFAHIRVWGEPSREHPGTARDLSWSWWLSRPVQQYLHQQTDAADRTRFEVENERPIDDLLHALADRTKRDMSTAPCEAYGFTRRVN
jgi:predicted acylesterase/phospholipase RssA